MRTFFAALLIFAIHGTVTAEPHDRVPRVVADGPQGTLLLKLKTQALAEGLDERVSQAVAATVKQDQAMLLAGGRYLFTVELDSEKQHHAQACRLRTELREVRKDLMPIRLSAKTDELCMLCNPAVLTEQLTRLIRQELLGAHSLGQGTAWK